MLPQKPVSHLEEMLWLEGTVPELDGKVVTNEQLDNHYPQTATLGKIVAEPINMNYFAYSISNPNTGKPRPFTRVAYFCIPGQHTVAGKPQFVNTDDINQRPLAGRRGFDVYCKACTARLDSRTYVLS